MLRYVSKTYGMVSAKEKTKTGKRDGKCWGGMTTRTLSRVVREGLTETLVFE